MRRIFVVGCPRSGTTLVQAMLARHPDVCTLQETYFFESLLGGAAARWGDRDARRSRRWYHRAGMAQSWGRRRLRELEQLYAPRTRSRREPARWIACVRRYVTLLDDAAESQGKSCWVEKTPNHLLFLDEIERHVPEAYFVHVLREGIDVVASLTDADMHQDTAAFRGGIAQWVGRWNHAIALHLARLGAPRHHLLCLEDLVANPDTEWNRLCAFLALDTRKPLLARPGSMVADARAEPWKRSAVAGIVGHPARKTETMFGPGTLAWLRAHLVDYQEILAAVRACRGGDESRSAGPQPATAPVIHRARMARSTISAP